MRYKGDREFSRKNAAANFRAQLESMRGHNYAYMTDQLWNYLEKMGYDEYKINGTDEFSEHTAKEIVQMLRSTGHYARIICYGNRLRIKEFHVYFKPKKCQNQN